ncbi:hypothetical protein Mame01_55200 [Microbispora amethystogenes]|nr:hypothetical protein Mame01_55200 [Microbispora amethystogenes]
MARAGVAQNAAAATARATIRRTGMIVSGTSRGCPRGTGRGRPDGTGRVVRRERGRASRITGSSKKRYEESRSAGVSIPLLIFASAIPRSDERTGDADSRNQSEMRIRAKSLELSGDRPALRLH